jgi:hypothetical protein
LSKLLSGKVSIFAKNLRAALLSEHALLHLHFAEIGVKAAHKILVKLTTNLAWLTISSNKY